MTGAARGTVRLLLDLLGALLVGVATIFQPKADPRQHWAVPPTFPVAEQGPERTDGRAPGPLPPGHGRAGAAS